MKILLAVLCFNIGSVAFATSPQDEKTLGSLVQTVCQYNQDVLLRKSQYDGCFDTMKECLNSPLWKYEENVTAYSVVGGFGYSCNFLVDKQTSQVVQFKFTDAGE